MTRNSGNGTYDLAIIGAGSAGFSAAIAGAEQGAQVALIGHGTLGGTCINVGCVPSKTLDPGGGNFARRPYRRAFRRHQG